MMHVVKNFEDLNFVLLWLIGATVLLSFVFLFVIKRFRFWKNIVENQSRILSFYIEQDNVRWEKANDFINKLLEEINFSQTQIRTIAVLVQQKLGIVIKVKVDDPKPSEAENSSEEGDRNVTGPSEAGADK